MIKKIFRGFFHLLGLEVSRYRAPSSPEYDYVRNKEMIEGLTRVMQRGLNPATIIDVGAAEGSWSLSSKEIWPSANYMLFEPLEERAESLKQLVAKNKNFHFVAAGAGKEKSQKSFYVSGDLDGSAVVDPSTTTLENIRIIEITSIDHEVRDSNLPGPYIIKLDTHGFEVPILEGAADTLKNTELVIIEIYGFHLTSDSLLFHEMSTLLDKLGFRMVDIVDIMRRSKDNAFWQGDAFYMRKDHQIFKDNLYN